MEACTYCGGVTICEHTAIPVKVEGQVSLRDHFAGLAMQAVIANPHGSAPNWDACAGQAYEAADAMIRAREVGG